MGTYLRTGIRIGFSADLSAFEDEEQETICKEVTAKIAGTAHPYRVHERGSACKWTIAPQSLASDLMAFLSVFYRDFYTEKRIFDKRCQPILTFLETNPGYGAFEAWAKENCGSAFYLEDFIFSRRATIRNETFYVKDMMLWLTDEGKVLYESIDGHLRFFTNTLRKRYKDLPFGGGIKVSVF